MDLFEAIALSLEDKPAEIRPAILSPYEVGQQSSDITEELEEINSEVISQTRKPSAKPVNVSDGSDESEFLSSSIEPAAGIQSGAQPIESPISLQSNQSSDLLPSPDLPTVRKEEVNDQRIPESPKPTISSFSQPLETAPLLLSDSHDEAQSESTSPRFEQGQELVQPQSMQAVTNSFFTENHTTNIESLTTNIHNLTSLHSDSRTENISNVTTGPSIDVIYPPIEIATHQTNHFQSVVNGVAPSQLRNDVANESEQEPSKIVEIHIGRIEINAPKSAAPTRRITTSRTSATRLTLDEILKKRGKQ